MHLQAQKREQQKVRPTIGQRTLPIPGSGSSSSSSSGGTIRQTLSPTPSEMAGPQAGDQDGFGSWMFCEGDFSRLAEAQQWKLAMQQVWQPSQASDFSDFPTWVQSICVLAGNQTGCKKPSVQNDRAFLRACYDASSFESYKALIVSMIQLLEQTPQNKKKMQKQRMQELGKEEDEGADDEEEARAAQEAAEEVARLTEAAEKKKEHIQHLVKELELDDCLAAILSERLSLDDQLQVLWLLMSRRRKSKVSSSRTWTS